jgi:predicted PurR-regulated permease PerM
MTKTMSYSQLMLIQNDLDVQIQNSPAFAFFLGDKIQRFFQRNATRIHHMNDKMQKLQQQYMKVNEQGVPIYIENELQYLEEAVNSKGSTVTGEDVRSAYKEEATEFLAINFKVEW